MSRQRRVADQPSGILGMDNLQQPPRPPLRPSVPLALQEPLPATTIGRFFFHLREIFYFARHMLYMLVFGVRYDMTPAEREEEAAREKARALTERPLKDVDMVKLGFIRSKYSLLNHPSPSNSTVILCGNAFVGELDDFAHALQAYDHLGPSAAQKNSRVIKHIGLSPIIENVSSGTIRAFPTFERASYGSVQSFILNTSSYPSLTHPSIPPSAAQLAMPLHWLLNLASAISFLHSHGVAHCVLTLNLLWLRADFSVALFDLTGSVFIEHDDERDKDKAKHGDSGSWGFRFPNDDIDISYYSSVSAEDAMEVGKATDVFDFGTVAWRILTRNVEIDPAWTLPRKQEEERGWSLPELRKRLGEAVPMTMAKGRYEPPGMDVIRKCWKLEYRNGGEILQALRSIVLKQGLKIQESDEIEGVAQAVEEFKKRYVVNDYLGKESWE